MGDGTTNKRFRGTPAGRRGRLAMLLMAALLVLVPVALAGCGSGDETTDAAGGTQESFPPNFVRDSDIDAQEDDSAGQALLDWWQSVQFADGTQAAVLTSPETLDTIGEKEFKAFVKTRGQGLQGIEIFETTEDGNEATVRAGLLTFQPEEPGGPPPDEPSASRPTSFVLVNEDGKWLFAATEYLEPMIENFIKSQKQAEKEK